jgi:putative spermidine/putrescine transport system permease protein
MRPLLLVGPPAALFCAFLLAPLFSTAVLSLHGFSMSTGIGTRYSLANYRDLLSDPYFWSVFARTFRLAAITTALCVLIGAPEAWIIVRMRRPWRSIFLLVAIGPVLISVISRTLGWAVLFAANGAINTALLALGIIQAPLALMYSETGVVIALTHVLVPFMVLSVLTGIQAIVPYTEAASQSLGAGALTTLRRVVLPQLMPGVLSGSIIVFAMATSSFATPEIIGGRRLKVIPTLIYDAFLDTLNWPQGAAAAVTLLVCVALLLGGVSRIVEQRHARTRP